MIDFVAKENPDGSIDLSAGIIFKVSQTVSKSMSVYVNQDHVMGVLKKRLLEGIEEFLEENKNG